ncbi:hypothetical protein BCR35DRAFT_334780 [Leucosporidium creatinivorum]|uniref:MYND-type domain-containing protein n=1 Tax=Leucosporidium creatinivorum TaxID=106004 RepID=A0A1Y2DWT8_9BASI|nr:hypothetical protein BCR35DRAFT_334780 [Leucosporidium creatinivorum]
MEPPLPNGIKIFPLDNITLARLSAADGSVVVTLEHYCLVSEIENHQYSIYAWDSSQKFWDKHQPLSASCARGMLKLDPPLPALENGQDYLLLKGSDDPSFEPELYTCTEGAVIHSGAPIYQLVLRPSQIAHQCFQCFRLEVDLGAKKERFMRCSGCKQAYYCSHKCQLADWSNTQSSHKQECSALAQGDFLLAWQKRGKRVGAEIPLGPTKPSAA